MGRRTYEHTSSSSRAATWPYGDRRVVRVQPQPRRHNTTSARAFVDDAARRRRGVELRRNDDGARSLARRRRRTRPRTSCAADLIDELHVAIHPLVFGRRRSRSSPATPIERRFDAAAASRPHRRRPRLQCVYRRPIDPRPRRKTRPSARCGKPTCATVGQDPATTDWTYLADAFADTPALQDELANLVLDRPANSATASSVHGTRSDAASRCRSVGDHLIVLDGARRGALRGADDEDHGRPRLRGRSAPPSPPAKARATARSNGGSASTGPTTNACSHPLDLPLRRRWTSCAKNSKWSSAPPTC